MLSLPAEGEAELARQGEQKFQAEMAKIALR
jgi:hypothetical protein